MEFVEPIKNIDDINAIKEVLRRQSQRDVLLFVLGINTGLRVSELLSLKVEDVCNGGDIKEFLYIEERAFYLNNSVKSELEKYLALFDFEGSDYLFKSKKDNHPITRQQAYRIINRAAKEVGIEGNIGTHTLRKTFGYHAFRKGISISILKDIFHHQSPAETLRYIGIEDHGNHPIKVDVNL